MKEALNAVAIAISLFALWKSSRDIKINRMYESKRARQNYNSELRSWADRCIKAFSEIDALLQRKGLDRESLNLLACRLSAEADSGRLFFPNSMSNRSEQTQEPAYQGFRPRILDWPILGCQICDTIQELPDTLARNVLNQLRRGFTSDAQSALELRSLAGTMEDLETKLPQYQKEWRTDDDYLHTSRSHGGMQNALSLLRQRKI